MAVEVQISVIVPAFNVEAYIERCITSLLSQDVKVSYEIRIIDDGSTDSTPEIVKRYVDKHPEILKYLRKENGGLSSARNLGIDSSNSEYIAFVDSDDYVDSSYLSSLYYMSKLSGVDISMCGINRVYGNTGEGHRFDSGFSNDFFSDNTEWVLCHSSFAAWNKLYRRELFDGLRFPVGITYEDFALIPQVMFRAKKVGYTHAVLYHYFVNENSIIMSKTKERKTDRNIIVSQEILEKSELQNSINILENFYIRRVLTSMAWRLLEYNEDIEEVKVLVVEGKKKYPYLDRNSFIRELNLAKRVFVKLLLNEKYFWGEKLVSSYSLTKRVYSTIRRDRSRK